ncbi:hypothetical protein CLFO_38260 [Clostridium formicaceticum]|uniref:Uncharacterized protein n=1 Tax=Clostridium formicaceticum TaxID=1497 RepID=A0AAC9RLR9_9CLOT|nr:hypothetical protein CLFO_38260 [Clostridium formicaceticum]
MPSNVDVLCSLLNKQSINYAKEMNFGSYRNVKLSMAEVLDKENRQNDRLST